MNNQRPLCHVGHGEKFVEMRQDEPKLGIKPSQQLNESSCHPLGKIFIMAFG